MSRSDNDNPQWTREMFRKAKRVHEAFPHLDFPEPKKGRGAQKTPTKVQTTIRLDRDLVVYFKREGRGWQSRINDALRDAVERRKPAKRRRTV